MFSIQYRYEISIYSMMQIGTFYKTELQTINHSFKFLIEPHNDEVKVIFEGKC